MKFEFVECEHEETDFTVPSDRGESHGEIIEQCLDCEEILNDPDSIESE